MFAYFDTEQKESLTGKQAIRLLRMVILNMLSTYRIYNHVY